MRRRSVPRIFDCGVAGRHFLARPFEKQLISGPSGPLRLTMGAQTHVTVITQLSRRACLNSVNSLALDGIIPVFRNALVVITTASLLVGGTALSGEIYKWTDADGDVHYGDRPIGTDVERLDMISSSTDNDAIQASIEARHDREAARSDARSKRNEADQAAADAKAEAAQRDVKCQESRSQMQTYLQSRRLYKQDDAGERVYLDEDQTMQARADAQEMIQKYCD